MRSDKELLVASKAFAQEHRGVSWWHLGSTLFILAGLTAVTLIEFPWPVRVAASIVAGLVHVRLFVLYHDYQHGSILRGSWLAAGVMGAYGLLSLNPPSLWTRSHDHHHRHNSKIFGLNIGSFPLMTTESYAAASARERFVYAVSRHPLTIGLGYFTIFLYAMCLRPFLHHPHRHVDAGIGLLVHGVLLVGLAAWSWEAPLLVIILPLTIASALGAYLFYAQHNFPGVKLREGGDWTYVDAALHASSFMPMNRLMRWFTANIGYHHVHHLNSRIPFYRLPEAMAALEELQNPGVTTLRPGDVIHCLRLKLWDPKQERLVPFPTPRRDGASVTITQSSEE